METQSSGAAATEPLKELPLKGYYVGKPTRISIEYDDNSSQHIGNANGSVDNIVENLQGKTEQPEERRAENGTGAQETGAGRTETHQPVETPTKIVLRHLNYRRSDAEYYISADQLYVLKSELLAYEVKRLGAMKQGNE